MSEKEKVQVNIAEWIIANGGCGSPQEVSCDGARGYFKGVECPIIEIGRYPSLGGCPSADRLSKVKKWLEEYNQKKISAKKEEQETKHEPARICENCKHIHDAINAGAMVVSCHKKGITVPVEFSGCPDFESCFVFTEISEQAFNHCYDLSRNFETSSCEIVPECLKARIAQLEKENNALTQELAGYTAKWSEVCTEKDSLIDRLRNENSRSIGEMYRAERELKDERRRKKEIEEENMKLRSVLKGREADVQKRDIMNVSFESNGEFPAMIVTFYPAIKKDRKTKRSLPCAAYYDGNKYGYLVLAEPDNNEKVILAADLPCATAEEAKSVAIVLNAKANRIN